MKYDCSQEFDLNLIYQKLTQPSCVSVVKACDFFTPQKQTLLARFQQKMQCIVTANQ